MIRLVVTRRIASSSRLAGRRVGARDYSRATDTLATGESAHSFLAGQFYELPDAINESGPATYFN